MPILVPVRNSSLGKNVLRRAATLIETLIAISVVAVFCSLVLAGIVYSLQVRDNIYCKNNLRQIVLGLSTHIGQDPLFGRGDWKSLTVLTPFPEILTSLNYKIEDPSQANNYQCIYPYAPILMCPTDSTLDRIKAFSDPNETTSYPYNALIFGPNTHFPNSIPDGMSNTVCFSERNAALAKSRYVLSLCSAVPNPGYLRPSSFADKRFNDNRPTLDPVTGTCNGSVTGVTFLVRPDLSSCSPGEMISGHAGGINLGYLDGSVRWVAPDISPKVFWSQMTPGSGD